MARPQESKSSNKPAPSEKADAKPVAKTARKRGKLMIVVIALVLLVGAGGGGAWWWMSRDAGTAQAKPALAAKAPLFMNLEPFTVNLLEESGEHYLQTSIVFQVADEKAMETMKAYLPVIRSRILMLLSSKKPSDLSSPAGKAKLVEDVTIVVRESMPGTTPDRGVVQAFLGAFVVQ